MSFASISGVVAALPLVALLGACGSSSDANDDADASATGAGVGGAGAGGAGGGGDPADACAAAFTADTAHLAAGADMESSGEVTVCLRWTAPEDVDVSGVLGDLGPLGHHALLFADPGSETPDGTAPCNDAELMDDVGDGFYLLAGVSYESSGKPYEFPTYAGYQIGLHVAKGTQLVFAVHLLNPSPEAATGCAWIDLDRSKPVQVPLTFRTVLPRDEYTLVVPAHGSIDVDVSEPAGSSFRVAAASSHMHAGGTHFRLSVQPSDVTLYETTNWADPAPMLFDTTKVVVDADDDLRIECTLENQTDTDQHFPEQMCVGGLYVLPCSYPGAC
jgi:hypothetical protein